MATFKLMGVRPRGRQSFHGSLQLNCKRPNRWQIQPGSPIMKPIRGHVGDKVDMASFDQANESTLEAKST